MFDETVAEMCRPYFDGISVGGELEHSLRRQLHDEIERVTGRAHWDSYMKLSAACAVKAWPIWESRFGEGLPVASPLAGATPEDPALELTPQRAELNRLNTFLDNQFRLGQDFFPAISAGFACWAVNRDALAGDFSAEPELAETDMDSEDWEPSFFASVAVAGGAIWEASGDSNARRRFWTWYLEEAVPRAYSARDSKTES